MMMMTVWNFKPRFCVQCIEEFLQRMWPVSWKLAQDLIFPPLFFFLIQYSGRLERLTWQQ